MLIQYDPTLPAADVADLQGLAGDDVIVAPNPTMASPIVATAWRVRQTCEQLDLSTPAPVRHRQREPGARRQRQHDDDRRLTRRQRRRGPSEHGRPAHYA